MLNRYGDEYTFTKIHENTYGITGNLKYWRFGGQEGQESIDYSNIGFADPSGGPFISAGYMIEGRKVSRIFIAENKICFEVEQ